MNANLIKDFSVIMQLLSARLNEHEKDIVITLKRVAKGELKLPETMSLEEQENSRAFFSWIAAAGPKKVLAMLHPEWPKSTIFQGEVSLDKIFIDPGFAVNLPQLDGDINKRTLARLAVLLMSYIFYEQFHYPQPETGIYNISGNPFQKLKWLYRYWFNQLEVAEKGSGLEDFFARQDLNVLRKKLVADENNNGFCDSVSVSCAGDLLAVDVLTPDNTQHLFDDIVDFYSTADIVSANLESTVDKDHDFGRYAEWGQPAHMNTSETMFQKFRSAAKINFFSTATNHAMDWGEEGVINTLNVLKKSGARYAGTAASQTEQDDVVVVTKKGIKVALLAYTFDLNGYNLPSDKPYLVNEVRFNDASPSPDYSLLKKQVAAAKAKGADWIIAYCHWGWEFEMYPHVNIVEAARQIIACGVDTILGNHAHVSQPAELIPRPGKQDALVIYAFGDFVSYHPESRNSKLAYTIKFNIGKSLNSTYLFNLEALPIYIVNEKLGEGKFNCRIVKFFDVLKNPDNYGLTELEKSQLQHLHDKVWKGILSPLSGLRQ